MHAADRVRAALVAAPLMWLAACTETTTIAGPELGRSSSMVVAKVQTGETADALAQRYTGRSGEGWRVSALDGGGLQPGAVAVISLGAESGRPQARIPVLCYHRFTGAARSKSQMEVTGADLEAQMKWLHDNGYRVVRLSELASFLRGEARLPPRAVVVTVDDGYKSLADVAFPIFKRYDAPFTVFVVTDFVGAKQGLSWAELKAIRDSGLGDVESHSKSHPDLRKRNGREGFTAYQSRVRAETEASRKLLVDHLGGDPPRYFAYPYGAADAHVVEQVRADYALALTVQRGGNASWADPLLLHRDMIYGADGVAGFARRREAAESGARP